MSKPKIDLKARLGKKTVTTPGGPSVPPPVGIPKPPLPGLGSRPSGPKVDASDPYAAISAEHATKAEPQAIKIEMSREVVEAQKKGRLRVVAIALVAAAVAGLLGYTFGDRVASNRGAYAAVEGAKALSKEVDNANAEIVKLADVLKAAKDELRENKFPEAQVSQLGSINIPFSGTNLVDKGVGRFNPKTLTMLLQYASGVQEANDSKENLQSLLEFSKATVLDLLSQQDPAKRKVRWILLVEGGPHGPWASLQQLPKNDWFLATQEKGKNWPAKVKLGDKELERYNQGDPTGTSPKVIPINPGSHGAVCPDKAQAELASQIGKLEDVLRGDQTPGEEKPGLIDLGDQVMEALRKIGQP